MDGDQNSLVKRFNIAIVRNKKINITGKQSCNFVI